MFVRCGILCQTQDKVLSNPHSGQIDSFNFYILEDETLYNFPKVILFMDDELDYKSSPSWCLVILLKYVLCFNIRVYLEPVSLMTLLSSHH